MIINLKRGWFGRHTHWVHISANLHVCTVRLLKHIDANLHVLGFVRLLVHVGDDEIIWGLGGLDIVVLDSFPLSPHVNIFNTWQWTLKSNEYYLKRERMIWQTYRIPCIFLSVSVVYPSWQDMHQCWTDFLITNWSHHSINPLLEKLDCFFEIWFSNF